MADEYSKLLYVLAGIGIAGYVGWSINAIINLKIRVSTLESKSDDIREMKDDIKKINSVVWEIAGKLGVPIRRD